VFAYADKIDDKMAEYGMLDQGTKTADNEASSEYIFRSYDHWGSASEGNSVFIRNPGPAHSIPIWQIARATTAAPTYFETIDISNRRFGDGGFGMNNPTYEMFMEVLDMNGFDPNCFKMIVSIGTGASKILRWREGVWAKYKAIWKAAKKMASDSEKEHVRMKGIAKSWYLPYHRLNVPVEVGLGKMKLDEYKADTFDRIEKITDDYCNTITDELEKIARVLVEHRLAKSRSDLWPLVATGTQYRCTVQRCRRQQQLLQRKRDLQDHFVHAHKDIAASKVAEFMENGVVYL